MTVLASGTIKRAFETRSGQTKEYKIGMCFFFIKKVRSMNTDCFAARILLANCFFVFV